MGGMFLRFRQQMRKAIPLLSAVFAVGLFVAPTVVLAQVGNPADTTIAGAFGLGTNTDIRLAIIRVVQFLLGFLGLLAVLIILYGGYLWMTAAGNVQRVEQAKLVLRNGLIGLVIILSAYALVAFVIRTYFSIDDIAGGPSTGSTGGPCLNCFALGAGIIEDHYPERDARDVPRNVMTIITFREPIQVLAEDDSKANTDSFIANAVSRGDAFGEGICGALWCGNLNKGIFTLEWTNNINGIVSTDAIVYTNDNHTFSIQPTTLMGSADANAKYTATVRGKTVPTAAGLTKVDGSAARLGSGLGTDMGFYTWSFDVSTIIDTTPPIIVDILPYDQETHPRSGAVLITFNEPINPISATGSATAGSGGFDNIVIAYKTTGQQLAGQYRIGNGYRTVAFLTNDKCGQNSCGQDIFCLPADDVFQATVKAATLWSQSAPCNAPVADPLGNAARACTPIGGKIFDGVVDVAGNSLDGQPYINPENGRLALPSGNRTANGASAPKADGPPADNFVWEFKTNNTIVNTGPQILQNNGVSPAPSAEGTDVFAPLAARFNRAMMPLTGYPNPQQPQSPPLPPVKIYDTFDTSVTPPVATAPTFGPVWTRQSRAKVCSQTGVSCTINDDCEPRDGLNFCGQEDVAIAHGTFALSQEYEVRIGSGIKDFTQNCFAPPIGPAGGNTLCADQNDPTTCVFEGY